MQDIISMAESASQTREYCEVGESFPGKNIIKTIEDISKLRKISRIVVHTKKFIWGIQIFYSDGTNTEMCKGTLEEEVAAETKELNLADSEEIEEIAGYAKDYITVLYIKTTSRNRLSVGRLPAGKFFCFKRKGLVIKEVAFRCTGYLCYLGVLIEKPDTELGESNMQHHTIQTIGSSSIGTAFITIDRVQSRVRRECGRRNSLCRFPVDSLPRASNGLCSADLQNEAIRE
eukprot:TRINITY_DN14710_c0_g1_i5.p1 TRINITY_DN14710_c0_g1~~TRINITY_DN14710_c0_g1_i5.p1  ORF type:complete len:231 (-),score=33.88 TRINITY_DN14710_c0_g1_i5:400-1092(-)